jgi:Multicopper oxidase
MSQEASRRQLLRSSFGALVRSVLLTDRSFTDPPYLLQAATPPTSVGPTLRATKRTLEINGKAADVMGLLQPNGTQGISSVVNAPFQVTLDNQLPVPTAIHWHGLHPPNNQDGVPGEAQNNGGAGATPQAPAASPQTSQVQASAPKPKRLGCPHPADPCRRHIGCKDEDFAWDEALSKSLNGLRSKMRELGLSPVLSYTGLLQTDVTDGSHQIWGYAGQLVAGRLAAANSFATLPVLNN